MIRLLVFTSLYPNSVQPQCGIFVEERIRQLLESGEVTARVVAPVPWFPFRHPGFGQYSVYASVPEREERYGVEIMHPRFPAIPKVGMGIAPFLMYRALRPVLTSILAEQQPFDLIDAHYFYPDGVAAVHLGHYLGKPVVITARGTDVNLIPRYRVPKRQILQAAKHAAAIVTVSQALKEVLVGLGVAEGKITTLRNGVDLDRFYPLVPRATGDGNGVVGPVWLSVGHLVELKGLPIVIAALAQIPAVTLLIVGEGPQKSALRQLARRLGVAARVRFLGAVRHVDLCSYYNASDVLILASSREGMPNVVLEALACGTPVIATDVGGIRELVTSPEAGELLRERTANELVAAWHRLCARKPDRLATRRFAERFNWLPTVQGLKTLYAGILAGSNGRQDRKTAAT